jgi:S1-C subfamily serine protease
VVVGAQSVLAYGATLRDQDGGAQVTAVSAGSPAAQAELSAGDVITAIAGAPIADARAAATALQGASGSVETTVLRNGETLSLTLSL